MFSFEFLILTGLLVTAQGPFIGKLSKKDWSNYCLNVSQNYVFVFECHGIDIIDAKTHNYLISAPSHSKRLRTCKNSQKHLKAVSTVLTLQGVVAYRSLNRMS